MGQENDATLPINNCLWLYLRTDYSVFCYIYTLMFLYLAIQKEDATEAKHFILTDVSIVSKFGFYDHHKYDYKILLYIMYRYIFFSCAVYDFGVYCVAAYDPKGASAATPSCHHHHHSSHRGGSTPPPAPAQPHPPPTSRELRVGSSPTPPHTPTQGTIPTPTCELFPSKPMANL